MAETEERARRIRTNASAVLLTAGTVLLWGAMYSPALRYFPRGVSPSGPITHPDGWEWVLEHPMFLPAFLALALAPAAWIGAAWFRSTWCRWTGLLLCAASAAAFVIALGTPSARDSSVAIFEMSAGRIDVGPEPGPAWWECIVAGVLLAASFAALPPPVRDAPGESRDAAVVRQARLRSAWVAATLAMFGILEIATSLAPGAWVPNQPIPALTAFGAMTRVPALAPAAWALWALPCVFVAAAWVRPLRFAGALAACVLLVVMAAHQPAAWWQTMLGPSVPLEQVIWYAAPAAFLLAFLLLPPRRDARLAPA